MGAVPPAQYAAHRAQDYPVQLVTAAYAPPIEIPSQLRGRAAGALDGAGEGIFACAEVALRAGSASHPAIAGLAVLFCVTVGSLVGGVAGAVTAEPADTSGTARVTLEHHVAGLDPQRALAESLKTYLGEFPVATVAANTPSGPVSAEDLPVYPAVQGAGGSLLELRVLKFTFGGSGRTDEPLCLHFTVRARKIDAVSGQASDDMQLRQSVGCFAPAQWLAPGDGRVATAIAAAYRRAAEDIADEFYLVYHPPVPAVASAAAVPRPVIPAYVLAPREPPPPEVYLDIDLFPDKVDMQGFGGLHFRDLETLSPTFSWETFPRAGETAAEGASAFSDVSYALRLWRGRWTGVGVAVAPTERILDLGGLDQPGYRIAEPLEPCSWYFWSVRARFLLHGAWRVTEWAGAYNTAGGHFSPSSSRRNVGSTFGFAWPSHYLYYPIRTPAPDSDPGCWEE